MLVKIKNIEPNPFRHVERYPLRPEKLAALKQSMESTGFWDNIVARPHPAGKGRYQIAFGHHRLHVLRELKKPGDAVELIVRDLDDTRMLKIMAAENMSEWASSASVEHETVRAVVGAFANQQVELGAVPGGTAHDRVRHAPLFKVGVKDRAAAHDRPYTAQTIATFLGWKPEKVKYALMAVELIEDGVLDEAEFKDLSSEQAKAVVQETRKALPTEPAAPAVTTTVTDEGPTRLWELRAPQEEQETSTTGGPADGPRDVCRERVAGVPQDDDVTSPGGARARAAKVGKAVADAIKDGKASTKTAKKLGAAMRGEETREPEVLPAPAQEPACREDVEIIRAFADLLESYCINGEIVPEVEARYRDVGGLAEQVQAQCRRMGRPVQALWALLTRLGFQP